jgi:hypothetical protein
LRNEPSASAFWDGYIGRFRAINEVAVTNLLNGPRIHVESTSLTKARNIHIQDQKDCAKDDPIDRINGGRALEPMPNRRSKQAKNKLF